MLEESLCPDFFRFTKSQIRRLYVALQFPAKFESSNGLPFTGEQILLAGLYRMTFPRNTRNWEDTFGWVQSRASIAFNIYLKYMEDNWIYLINDNTQ